MSNIKIFYSEFYEQQKKVYDYPLTREIDLVDKSYEYTQCPVWSHKANRTFIARSPIDFLLLVDDKNKKIDYDDKGINLLNPYFKYTHIGMSSPKKNIQLLFPSYVFWSNTKNIWFEFNPHQLTTVNNNFTSISGWFNIDKWPRETSLSIDIIDDNKPIIIKKGDPLYKINFYGKDLNSGIILKKEKKIPQRVLDIMLNNRSTHKTRSVLNRILFGKTKECPFKFLH
jgi:hypothetical protein